MLVSRSVFKVRESDGAIYFDICYRVFVSYLRVVSYTYFFICYSSHDPTGAIIGREFNNFIHLYTCLNHNHDTKDNFLAWLQPDMSFLIARCNRFTAT